MRDSCGRVVDGEEEGGQTKFGQGNFEERLIHSSRCEDSNDLLRRYFIRKSCRLQVEGGIMSCQPVYCSLDVGEAGL